MNPNEYQKLAMTTLNKDLSKKDVLINGVMGLCGESGEAIDIVKKHLKTYHTLDNFASKNAIHLNDTHPVLAIPELIRILVDEEDVSFKDAMAISVAQIWILAGISAVGALISMVGDLAASAIKRNYDVKDYGKLIPGHGGIMDRFDSVIFTAPIIYYMAIMFL